MINGGFERVKGEDPEGWTPSGRARPGARVRAVAIADAPGGRRVAEISMRAGGEPIGRAAPTVQWVQSRAGN